MRGHRSFFLLQCIPTLTLGFIAEPLLLTQHPMQSRGPDQQGLLLCMAVRQSVLRGLELGLYRPDVLYSALQGPLASGAACTDPRTATSVCACKSMGIRVKHARAVGGIACFRPSSAIVCTV